MNRDQLDEELCLCGPAPFGVRVRRLFHFLAPTSVSAPTRETPRPARYVGSRDRNLGPDFVRKSPTQVIDLIDAVLAEHAKEQP